MEVGGEGHVPVLLDSVLERLAIDADGIYMDGTFGRGGHSRAILARLGPTGRLIVLDQDPQALATAEALAAADTRVTVAAANFRELRAVTDRLGVTGNVAGILLDLGVSSPQLDDGARGFSFMRDGPLDMRMNPTTGISAADWLNSASERDIAQVLLRYGEERAARRIARAIVRQRERQPLQRTTELAELIAAVIPRHGKGRHPATQSFQAIRIFINDELGALQAFLADVLDVLAIGGRLCVISFHSLEDRMVKRFLRDGSRPDPALAALPVVPASARPRVRLLAPAVRADTAEAARNPRARSAVLRAGVRLA